MTADSQVRSADGSFAVEVIGADPVLIAHLRESGPPGSIVPLGHDLPVREPGVAGPARWQVVADHAVDAPRADLAGFLVEPVTPAMIERLLAGEPAPAVAGAGLDALAAVTVFEDPETFERAMARALGGARAGLWFAEEGHVRPLVVGGGGDGSPDAAQLAADFRLPVIADDGGQVVTWVATWCARPGDGEHTALAGVALPGVVVPGEALEQALATVSRRLGAEMSWLLLHQRILAEQERLRAAMLLDPLTQVWTRAAFDHTLEVEMAGARRRGESLAMVVFDVDELRRVNDAYGHAGGDAVLAHVAAVVRANVRVNDELGRVGDDEIAVLLMNADQVRAAPVAEKLVRKILDTPLMFDGEPLRFTVRAGVTGFRPHERNGDLALARASRALDEAAGLANRVAVCDDSGIVPAVSGLDEDAQVGSAVGHTFGGTYRVVHEISRGASGIVYRGEDLALGRPVAIKVLRHDLGRDDKLVAHFRREASILASLRHPNLVEVYSFGAGEDVYFVMELVEGPTAADLLEDAHLRGESLDPHAVAEVISEVGDALEAMHAAGLVHCDVKPENIVLDRRQRRAVLLDVGEAKRHDEVRRRAGTPGYAAPESFGDGEETARIDVYSLGATAYTLLTGRMPFGSGDALAILARQLDAAPEPPSSLRKSLPQAVDLVVGKAMAVDPAQRFQSPGALAAALRSAVRTAGADAARPLAAPGHLRALTAEDIAAAIAPASAPAAVVRGAAFRVATKVLAARVGEPWLRRLAQGRRDLAEVLQPTLPPLSWQPLRLLVELVSGVGQENLGEVLRTVGRGMVSVTFGHLYGADPTRMSTEGLLLAVPTLWDRYFGFGSVEVGVPEDRRMEMTVMHQADLGADDLIAGFFERIAELTGVSDARVTVTAGLEDTRFLVEWTP